MTLSSCTSVTPLLRFESCCAVVCREEQYDPSLQLGFPGPPDPTATGEVPSPLQNSVSPLMEAIIGTSAPGLYCVFILSAMRPAQPVLPALLFIWFCHSCCWSV